MGFLWVGPLAGHSKLRATSTPDPHPCLGILCQRENEGYIYTATCSAVLN